ncbi:MAG: ribonuclease J [Oscillospiraceae bacterium]|nr:ribonuclease J [Oscillospiraceae bacterium]
MAEKLKIIPLGGLGEIGKNITVYEHGDDILIVDCGLCFPDGDMLGVDLVIPDFTYLEKNRNRIRAVAITHGHEDHIGAVSFLLREIAAPVYATPLTAGLIKLKLEEAGLLQSSDVREIKVGQHFSAGCFTVEFINVNHSIADAAALAIKTPQGIVIHTGDFKIDSTPVDGGIIDLPRIGQLGKKGILALLSDSTNVERPGYAMSERHVGEAFEPLFRNFDHRIIVTTFASNVHRLQQVIDCAARHDRRVAITGRSMENILRLSAELGYMKIPDGVMIDVSMIRTVPANKLVIITTGSQGEPMSALYRIAFSSHKLIDILPGDRVIVSASPVPGNEKTVSKMINELVRRGAEVVYEKLADVHVSGHACQEELKLMIALCKPKYFIPLHGEYRHLKAHAALARSCGIPPENIIITDVGRVLELGGRSFKHTATVPSGRVLVDGLGVGDVGSVVLRDRKHLASDGLLVVVLTVDSASGEIIAGPDIITRGFIYVKESEDFIEQLRQVVLQAIGGDNKNSDWQAMKSAIRASLSDYLYKKTKRGPMILPVITEV